MRKGAKLLLKIALALALLGALALKMDLRQFLAVLSSASLPLIALATLVQVLIILIAVYRWRVILENFQIHTPPGPLTKIMFIGQFFNLFLPSAVGGDFFRAYYLSKREKRGMSTTLMTTLLERSAGLFALLAIGCLSAAFHPMIVKGFNLLYLFLGLSVAFMAINVAIFNPSMHRRITRLLCRLRLPDIESKLDLVYRGLGALRKNPRALVDCLLTSFIIQFVSVVIMWLAALAIGISAPFSAFLVFIPVVNLTLMIPLTPNSLGLREGVYFLLFTQIGVTAETAVALSLMNFLIPTLASLPGAVIYSLYKKEEDFGEIPGKPETP
jgi:uncharacterized protein (TIRG00374 family)